MGLNFFVDSDSSKSPLEPKVHFTYSSANMSYSGDFKDNEEFWKEFGSWGNWRAVSHLASFFTCFSLFWFSVVWIGLTTRQLVSFYTYLLAFACVPLSFLANCYTMNTLYHDVRLEKVSYFPLFTILSKFLIDRIHR